MDDICAVPGANGSMKGQQVLAGQGATVRVEVRRLRPSLRADLRIVESATMFRPPSTSAALAVQLLCPRADPAATTDQT